MAPRLTLRKSSSHLEMDVTVTIKLPLGASMLEQENAIQRAIHLAGLHSTQALLASLDTQGDPLEITDEQGRVVRFTAKRDKVAKEIETPYGKTVVERFLYQSCAGGACLVPLDCAAGLIGAATPKFAQMVSSKVAQMPARAVQRDLQDNHARPACLEQLQQVAQRVALLAEAAEPHLQLKDIKELPAPKAVHTISVGVDAASILMSRASEPEAADRRKARSLDWRMGMVGSISFYDARSERLMSVYQSQSPPKDPQEGKAAFWQRMESKLSQIKKRYPKARYTGVSDGAPDLAEWLQKHTEVQVLDYYHAAAYLDLAAPAFYKDEQKAGAWAVAAREEMRDAPGGARALLEKMQEQQEKPMGAGAKAGLAKAIGYMAGRMERMDYAGFKERAIPIGSGVTESACKRIIKQRMGGPGMRWGYRAAQQILTLRCLLFSDGHWRTLWNHLSPPAAIFNHELF